MDSTVLVLTPGSRTSPPAVAILQAQACHRLLPALLALDLELLSRVRRTDLSRPALPLRVVRPSGLAETLVHTIPTTGVVSLYDNSVDTADDCD